MTVLLQRYKQYFIMIKFTDNDFNHFFLISIYLEALIIIGHVSPLVSLVLIQIPKNQFKYYIQQHIYVS